VLDEPTNDIDLETLDLLQEVLGDYPGTVLLTSHDRDFLDRVATSVIVAEGNGTWQEYAGGYSDMLAQRGIGVTAKAALAATPNKTPPKTTDSKAPPPARIKLSNKQQQALKTLPGTIDTLTAQIARLNTALANHQGDHAGHTKIAHDLATTMAALSAAEDEWLELLELQEQTG